MIYLDNAATSFIKPGCVKQAVYDAFDAMGNCGRGVNGQSLTAARLIYDARCAVKELFGAPDPEHAVFASGATEALNMAIFGSFKSGEHIICTALDHNSVLRPLHMLEDRGAEVSVLPAGPDGVPRYELLEGLLRSNTKGIVCTHASNLTGQLVDTSLISVFAHGHGLRFILDAAQTAGAREVTLSSTGADIICFTGHKSLLGPQGTGGLVFRDGIEIEPYKAGGTGIRSYDRLQPARYPERLEPGTLNGHGIAGLQAAIEFILETGLDAIHEKELALTNRFYAGVSKIEGVTVYGRFGCDRAPVAAINIGDMDSADVGDILYREYDISVRTGAHCAPLMHEALGTTARGAVRFSFGYFNTDEEIDTAVNAVREISR